MFQALKWGMQIDNYCLKKLAHQLNKELFCQNITTNKPTHQHLTLKEGRKQF